MKRHFQLLSFALSIAACLFFTACSTDEGLNPNQEIDERGFLTGSPQSSTIIGLSPDNHLLRYHTSNLHNILSKVEVNGLDSGQTLLAIDIAPGSGRLYGVSSNSMLYMLDPNTGKATRISPRPFEPLIEGTMVGLDYNPVDGMLRLVTDADQNLRIDPSTGEVVGVDVSITPSQASINSIAYTPGLTSKSGAALYDIDVATGTLFKQNYNAGTLTTVGSLGVTLMSEGGFDISPKGFAWAVFEGFKAGGGLPTAGSTDTSQPAYRLWNINLKTGVATSMGQIEPLIGIAAL